MDRGDVLATFPVIEDARGLTEVYRPLVDDLGADWVSIQVCSLDPETTIARVGEEVLPSLRRSPQEAEN